MDISFKNLLLISIFLLGSCDNEKHRLSPSDVLVNPAKLQPWPVNFEDYPINRITCSFKNINDLEFYFNDYLTNNRNNGWDRKFLVYNVPGTDINKSNVSFYRGYYLNGIDYMYSSFHLFLPSQTDNDIRVSNPEVKVFFQTQNDSIILNSLLRDQEYTVGFDKFYTDMVVRFIFHRDELLLSER